MTGGTIDEHMFAFQIETGGRVIKIADDPDRPEGFFIMALPAILPEAVVMDIFVAIGAIGEFHSGENLEFCPFPRDDLMATGTFHFLMLSIQREFSFRMIEMYHRLEKILSMTIGTTG